MTTIFVPAPPKNAFNKDRPVSDLLKGQLKHFHHLEALMPPELRSGMTARDYVTEAGAAKYIAHMTNAFKRSGPVVTPIRRAAKAPQKLALAAAAAPPKTAAKKSVVKKAAKKSAAGKGGKA